ncbi:proprotein convertase subtilisin/kexin type 7-like [Siphateles boraxobius]|uniref:proprotein convertase subtilisin/kexin type 7-like n=1 Tax=Siphateles boraxobius TaxID=180520 RepID=UPI004063C6D9
MVSNPVIGQMSGCDGSSQMASHVVMCLPLCFRRLGSGVGCPEVLETHSVRLVSVSAAGERETEFVWMCRVVEDAMSGQYLTSSFALPCPPGIDVPPEIVSPFTSSSLNSLLLLGCLALFWSLYYTLEVTLAHWDWRGCGGAVRG